LVKRRKIDYLRGRAVFLDEKQLKLENPDGGPRRIAFQHAIIATGSRAATLSLFDRNSDRVLNAARALDLEEIPKKLLVVGGGYIGLELGSVYASLGSKVSLVEMTPGLLPGVDRDLVRPLHNLLKGQFEEIRLQAKVTQVKTRKNGLQVMFENQEGETEGFLFDKILVAVGRQPNSRNLGLETIGIKVDEKGFIQVDEQRRTSLDHIFAIGDVAGEPMLAHKASHEGRVAVEVIAGRRAAYEPQAIPAVIFTDPEIAWAGLTESQAKAANLPFKVARFPWAASSRAATLGRSEGLTKLLVEPETERVLGMGIVGSHAGELIAEGVLAIEMGANVTDLALSIHPHPTLSETVMEAAHVFHGTATHFHHPKRKGE
jgi:dihydrolipoamide dehydrogenase